MSRKTALIVLLGLALLSAACTRSATSSNEEIASLATEKAVQTADAEIQQTLEALLGSATVAAPSATSQATNTTAPATATATVNGAQLTELAAVLTESGEEATAEATEEGTPSVTATANATSSACYGARYVYDESYPDGTRVDPGQLIEKTWRMQNVGTCNWTGGEYQLVFVSGDRMNGTTPLTINITVLPGNYANFTINFKAPAEPGTYHGDWMFQTESGDQFGVGPNFDLPIWIEIIVRG